MQHDSIQFNGTVYPLGSDQPIDRKKWLWLYHNHLRTSRAQMMNAYMIGRSRGGCNESLRERFGSSADHTCTPAYYYDKPKCIHRPRPGKDDDDGRPAGRCMHAVRARCTVVVPGTWSVSYIRVPGRACVLGQSRQSLPSFAPLC